jgi:hypothetical protein
MFPFIANRKTFLLLLTCALIYLMKHMPIPTNTSTFLKLLDKGANIQNIKILNETALFTAGNKEFYTNINFPVNNHVVHKLM